MIEEAKLEKLAALLRETGESHHQAFYESDGQDPEWPLWYAEFLQDRLEPYLAAPITRSRLVFCLVEADDEHRVTDPDTPWPQYYARRILECLGRTEAPNADRLALYHFDGCPFCARVRRAIDALGIEVELRDIHGQRRHFEELLAARGRTTVPVLRITSADGTERWMPESVDIVRYLEATYSQAA